MHTCRPVLSTIVLCCQTLATGKIRKRFLEPLDRQTAHEPAHAVVSRGLSLLSLAERGGDDTPGASLSDEAYIDHADDGCDHGDSDSASVSSSSSSSGGSGSSRSALSSSLVLEADVVDVGVPGAAKRVRSEFLEHIHAWRNAQLRKTPQWRPSLELAPRLVELVKLGTRGKAVDASTSAQTAHYAAWAAFFEQPHAQPQQRDECAQTGTATTCAACAAYASMLRCTVWLHARDRLPAVPNLPDTRVHLAILQHRVYAVLTVGIVPTDANETHVSAIALGRVGALAFPRDPDDQDVQKWSSWCHKRGAANDKKAATKLKPVIVNFGWRLVFASRAPMQVYEALEIARSLHSYIRENTDDLNQCIPHDTIEAQQTIADDYPRLFNAALAVYAVQLAYNLQNAIHFEREDDVIHVLY